MNKFAVIRIGGKQYKVTEVQKGDDCHRLGFISVGGAYGHWIV